jgi:hypothetical protein
MNRDILSTLFFWAEIIHIEIVGKAFRCTNRPAPHGISSDITLLILQHAAMPNLINLDEPISNRTSVGVIFDFAYF